MRPLSLAPIALALLIAGCNGDDDTDEPTWDTGPAEEDTCEADEECEGYSICEDSVCVEGDRNEDFETAEALAWAQAHTDDLHEGDQDYFSFNAEGGEFVRIDTTDLDDDEDFDMFVTLYDPNGKVHHQEDDHAVGPVSTYDTVMYTYLHLPGTWTIIVEDGDGDGSGQYEVEVQEVSNHTRETDSIDSPSYDVDAANAGSIWAVGVLLEEPGDVDWIEIKLPYDDCPVYLMGSTYVGGTGADPTIEAYDADQAYRLRKEGLGPDGAAYHPSIDGGVLYVAAQDSLGGGGDDYWFYVYVQIDEQESASTEETEPNDDQETAVVTEFEWGTYSSGSYEYGYAPYWGSVDELNDEDWYLVSVPDGYFLTVLGSSDAIGSTLEPELGLYNEFGVAVDYSAEPSDAFPDFYNLLLEGGGTYYLQVSGPGGINFGADYYYTLAVYVTETEASWN